MQPVARETVVAYERRLEEAKVPPLQRPQDHKWTRFYLDFCHKYGHPPGSPTSLGPFLTKLAAKSQSFEQREQAAAAVGLLIGPPPQPSTARTVEKANGPPSSAVALPSQHPVAAPRPAAPPPTAPPVAAAPPPARSNPAHHASGRPAGATPPLPGRGASWQSEYRDLEASIKMRNYSRKTLAAYRFWVAKFQSFVRSRPTGELGANEVRGFLSELAVRYGVAASTQNQAFNALLFFYRHVLRREFGKLDGVVRAKRHRYVPVVLSRSEMEAVLGYLQPPYHQDNGRGTTD